MSTARSMRLSLGASQGPDDEPATLTQVDVTREAIIARCPRVETACPVAIEVAAEQIAALHGAINGHAAELAGNRSPKEFREALRGERALTGEDIARLAIQAPGALVEWVRPLLLKLAAGAPGAVERLLADVAPEIGHSLQPLTGASSDKRAALGALVEQVGRIASKAGAALGDGIVTAEEEAAVDEEIPELDRRVADWKARKSVSA